MNEKLGRMCDRLARELVKQSPEDLELAVALYRRGAQLSASVPKSAQDMAKATYTWLLMRKTAPETAWQLSGMDKLLSSAAKP
jgi:hypothetical protein